MSENTQNTQNTENTSTSTENTQPQEPNKDVTPLARGSAPALGAPQIPNTSDDKDNKDNKNTTPAETSKAPEAKDDTPDDELAKTDEAPDDRYIETTITEVNDLVGVLKQLKVPYAKANMLLEEAFNSGDSSKLNLDNFEAILGKNNAKSVYMYAKVALAAVKSAKEADARELDTLSGGSWKGLATKAKQMLPKRDLKEYQELIDMGGAARKLAIRELIAKTSTSSNNKPLLTGDNSTAGDDYMISKRDYLKEADKIRKEFSRAGMLTREGFDKMKALDARRLAAIKAGVQ